MTRIIEKTKLSTQDEVDTRNVYREIKMSNKN